jgi:mannose-1-phosphate guanylyltransferase
MERFAGTRIVLEPKGRNSGPAIAAAALIAAEQDPDNVLWLLAADHAVEDTATLHAALNYAAVAARQGHIVLPVDLGGLRGAGEDRTRSRGAAAGFRRVV